MRMRMCTCTYQMLTRRASSQEREIRCPMGCLSEPKQDRIGLHRFPVWMKAKKVEWHLANECPECR